MRIRWLYLGFITLIPVYLISCHSEVLERQAQQIKDQQVELARQRKEIDELMANRQTQDQKQRDCNRAFRDYFEKAHGAADSEKAVSLYREGLAICPDDEIAHYELGKALADSGRNAEATVEAKAHSFDSSVDSSVDLRFACPVLI